MKLCYIVARIHVKFSVLLPFDLIASFGKVVLITKYVFMVLFYQNVNSSKRIKKLKTKWRKQEIHNFT